MGKEIVEQILSGKDFTLECITSKGDISPDGFWYDDDRYEWVMVTKGRGELEFFGGSRLMINEGEYYLIKPNERHRVSYTSEDCVWIALYYRT